MDVKKDRDLSDIVGDYLTKSGVSQGRLAREIGMTPAVISQFLKGKYQGDVAKLEETLKNWLLRQEKKKKAKKIPLVDLSNFEKVYNYLAIAHEDKTISFIVGPAGMGKTTSIREFAKDNNNIYIVDGESGLTEFSLLRALGHKMGVRAKSTVKLKEDIINTLKDKDAMVIIDEANYLAKGLLDILRRVVYDQAGTPLAFVGVKDLMTNIFENPRDFQQLQSRVGVYGDFSNEKASLQDVRSLADTIFEGVSDRLLKEVNSICNGSVRLIVALLERCARLLGVNGSDLDEDIIAQARQSIFLAAKR